MNKTCWTSVVDESFNRYFILAKEDSNTGFYIVTEGTKLVQETDIFELQALNFKIVGLAFDIENEKCNQLLDEYKRRIRYGIIRRGLSRLYEQVRK